MTETDIKATLLEMGSLWYNFRPPGNPAEEAAAIAVWTGFFKSVSREEVERTILEIASEGAAFAPQPGQIYARLKDNRGTPRRSYIGDALEENLRSYAAILGVEPRRPGESYREVMDRLRLGSVSGGADVSLEAAHGENALLEAWQ